MYSFTPSPTSSPHLYCFTKQKRECKLILSTSCFPELDSGPLLQGLIKIHISLSKHIKDLHMQKHLVFLQVIMGYLVKPDCCYWPVNMWSVVMSVCIGGHMNTTARKK